MTSEMKPVDPKDLAWSEADGAVSINAEAVADRLNALLDAIQQLHRSSGRCHCMNCVVIGA